MPRFQSRLFNWIDQSLPVQLGRQARRLYKKLSDRLTKQEFIPTPDLWQSFREKLVGRTERALLYPLYALAQAIKHRFPALNPSPDRSNDLRIAPKNALTKVTPSLPISASQVTSQFWASTETNIGGTEITASELDLPNQNADQNLDTPLEQVPDQVADLVKLPRYLIPLRNFILWIEKKMESTYPTSVSSNSSNSEIEAELKNQVQESAIANCDHPLDIPPHQTLGTQLTPSLGNAIANKADEKDDRYAMLLSSRFFLADWQQFSTEIGQRSPRLNQKPANLHEQRVERIRQLIRAAIAYFFGKRAPVDRLKPDNSDNSGSLDNPGSLGNQQELPANAEQPWLTMADLFGDDSGPWPQPSHQDVSYLANQLQDFTDDDDFSGGAIAKASPTKIKKVKKSAMGALSNRETAGSMIAEPEQASEGSLESPPEPNIPLKAWIETQAIFMGYVYSPVMEVIHWLDRLIARIETWFIQLWQKLQRWIKKILKR